MPASCSLAPPVLARVRALVEAEGCETAGGHEEEYVVGRTGEPRRIPHDPQVPRPVEYGSRPKGMSDRIGSHEAITRKVND